MFLNDRAAYILSRVLMEKAYQDHKPLLSAIRAYKNIFLEPLQQFSTCEATR